MEGSEGKVTQRRNACRFLSGTQASPQVPFCPSLEQHDWLFSALQFTLVAVERLVSGFND